MKILKSLALLTLALLSLAPATAQEGKTKIGTVNMQKLVADYYKTGQTREAFKSYETEIQKQNETRVDSIKALIEAGREIQKQAEEPSFSREKKQELFQKAGRNQQEAQALQDERVAWLNRKKAALTEKANVEFGLLRREILSQVKAVGDELGYDFIFDRSGASGANVPILSFAKDATDLTATLLERINRDAPAPEKSE